MAVVDEIVTHNYVLHNPPPGLATGIKGFKQLVTMYHTGFPDLHISIEDMIEESDKVVVRWSSQSTHKGPFMGISPTNKRIAITGISILRLKDGKVSEEWTEMDTLGVLRQMGATPQ